MEEDSEIKSTLSVSAWAKGMEDQVVFIQVFTRSPHFHLIDEAMVAYKGEILPQSAARPHLDLLRSGIAQHPDGGPKCDTWRGDA